MAAARNVAVGDGGLRLSRDEESVGSGGEGGKESPSAKRFKSDRFPLTRWEFAAFVGVFLLFASGLFCIYLTMPPADYGKLKLPRTIAELRTLKYVTITPPSVNFSLNNRKLEIGSCFFFFFFQR